MTLYFLPAALVAVALRLRSQRWHAAHVVLGLLWPWLLAGLLGACDGAHRSGLLRAV